MNASSIRRLTLVLLGGLVAALTSVLGPQLAGAATQPPQPPTCIFIQP